MIDIRAIFSSVLADKLYSPINAETRYTNVLKLVDGRLWAEVLNIMHENIREKVIVQIHKTIQIS